MYKLIGLKKDMTQTFQDGWEAVPVSLVDVSKNVLAGTRGSRVVVGFGTKRRPNNSEIGIYRKLGYVPKTVVEANAEEYGGKKIGSGILRKDLLGAEVDVTGISKGKGFAGGHKRFDIKGGPKTRGQASSHRKIGSIGSQTPGRVYKGVKMPGHMGHVKVTVKNLKIVYVDTEEGIIGLSGHVPGGRNTILTIKVKKWGEMKSQEEETGGKEQSAEVSGKADKSAKATKDEADSGKIDRETVNQKKENGEGKTA